MSQIKTIEQGSRSICENLDKNKYSVRSIEIKLPALIENYDGPTEKPILYFVLF